MIRPLSILALMLAAPALAQGFSALKGHDSDAPIDIASDHIEVQDRANRAIWTGNVHAVQGDMTMDAERMTVAYAHGATPGADPQIQRIDASGGVTVVSPSERAKGNFGIYDLNRKLITLIGNVALTRGTNTVRPRAATENAYANSPSFASTDRRTGLPSSWSGSGLGAVDPIATTCRPRM